MLFVDQNSFHIFEQIVKRVTSLGYCLLTTFGYCKSALVMYVLLSLYDLLVCMFFSCSAQLL